ncbi:hypothetical protein ACQKCH_11830 [Nubsella zeaxanthinifaciens]|uniref:hypothetical protein n=1 Tax=Nubsella zeaxanthinifaciens TaxID=392412 RepID=UPI003D01C33E
MKKLLLIILLGFTAFFAGAQGKIGYLSFTSGPSSANNLNPQDNPIEGNYKLDGLTNMTLSRGGGLTYTNNSTYSYVGLLPAGGNRADAITNNVYYELKLNAASKFLYLKSLDFRLRTADVWTAADVTYRWFYSIGNTNNFVEIGNADVLLGFTNTNGDVEPTIDLSGIAALQQIAPNTNVYFRIYAWGAKAKQSDGVTDVSTTTRGFGFGKSSASTTELITFKGYVAEGPLAATWDFSNINASTYAAEVASSFQQSWLRKSTTENTLLLARGAGLEKASLNNAYAVTYKSQVLEDIPLRFNDAVTKETYYKIDLTGDAVNYTQLLGYRMKFRGNSTTATNARWQLVLGDGANEISPSSPVVNLGNDVPLSVDVDGIYYSLALANTDLSAVIPPGKKAELRLYVWGGTSTTGVFGLGRSASETHLQLYAQTLTPAAYLQVLPVNLISFKATKQNSAARLTWSTKSEQNNANFNVLRAGDDRVFKKIGQINGAGNSSDAKIYNFTDFQPLSGNNYYQLTQTDFDGKTKEIGDVQLLNFDNSKASLTILNGNQSVKALLVTSKTANAKVALHGVSGNLIYQSAVSLSSGVNQIELPVNLTNGLYILQVKSQFGESWSAKFTKSY